MNSSNLGLSESPASVATALFPRAMTKHQELSLQEFIRALPETIQQNKSHTQDLIGELMQRLVLLDPEDYQEYAHFNSSKNYTRNLIATDHKSYTLMLLCWNAGKSSPIHDHPCDGCWMRVVMGSVQECRYNKLNSAEECLTCVSNDIYTEGQQAFIQDSMGYHKVGNPSHSKPAITLHLYCPPFETCKIWMDPHDSVASCTKSNVCYHSEYGFIV